MKSYRGNLYKQTLSPSWSKSKLRDQQNKFNKIVEELRGNSELSNSPGGAKKVPGADASKRESFFDTRMTPMGQTWSGSSGGDNLPRHFTKTVTNFAQVRYDDNGGLNPQSPVKRGLALNVTTKTAQHPSQWQRTSNSTMRVARPSLELDVSERAVSVFVPKKIVRDVEHSKKMFKKYSAYKTEVDPSSSKVDYKHFLDKVMQD